jgi:hypothetical protein
LPVPTNGWINGGWNKKSTEFYLLAEMLGLKQPSISPDDLQELYRKVSTAKVFAENVQPFLEATGWDLKRVQDRLFAIEAELGLLRTLPFMSLRGMQTPSEFRGVAIWPAGITNWTDLRLREILTVLDAGAQFDRVIVLGSSRVCKAPADRRHPLIDGKYAEGEEPTERELQEVLRKQVPMKYRKLFKVAKLPQRRGDPVMPLQAQLDHLMATGQYAELLGGEDIYVPSTPNSLYVPLHVMRVTGRNNVWFSQIQGAHPLRQAPDGFMPGTQDILTTPNGIIRLWVELILADCITN